MERIRMGVPTGSLLDRARTDDLLRQAGWDIFGYEPGLRSYRPEIRNFDIELVATRPQEIPLYLFDGRLDVGITGDDWVEDRALVGKRVPKLTDLEYGDVRVVIAIPAILTDMNTVSEFLEKYRNRKIICSTEYVNTAFDAFSRNETYRSIYGNKTPLVYQEGRKSYGVNPYFIIEKSEGTTEGKPGSRLADIIVENTASGRTLQENELKIIETIRISTAGLYGNPEALNDKIKTNKIEVIRRMLMGVVKARKDSYVVINFPNEKREILICYLDENKLYAKEPSIVEGKEWSQVSIEMPNAKWPSLVEDLFKLGIDDVVRLPPSQIIAR